MLTILAKVIPIENDMVQKDYGNLGHTGIYTDIRGTHGRYIT